ncbi:MAG: type II toxin-antitoxin system RelE/ParE family toxin [Candidatus Aenigmatarchaeota archaeon]
MTRKNPALKTALERQIAKILMNPMQGKPLRAPLAGKWRVHVSGAFVLIYEFSESANTVLLRRFAHHDEAYGL